MRQSLRLGSIAGIEVGVNWSVLIVFALIAWQLAVDELPLQAPSQSGTAYWVAGVATAIVFFASLLAHEMSHALVAAHDGVEVEGITLWLFGGIAHLRTDTSSAASEFRITAAGPLMSLTLAGVFWGLDHIVSAAGAPQLIAGVFRWLAVINAVLALFNLIPAFPLDGGRLLRALLWSFIGKSKATAATSVIGEGFGILMIAAGLWFWVHDRDAGGVWFAFLGWFLFGAARGERRAVARSRSYSRLPGAWNGDGHRGPGEHPEAPSPLSEGTDPVEHRD